MRALVLALVGGSVLFVAACGGGSCGDGDDGTGQQTSPSPVAATGAAASQPAGTPAGTAAGAPATSATPSSGAVNLTAALLTAADMPSGWSEANLNIDLAATQPCGRPIPVVEAAAAQQDIAYRESRLGPYVAHRVMAFAGGNAEQAMNATRALLDQCKEWKGMHGGRELTFQVSPSSLPVSGLGDQAFAVQLTIHGFAGSGAAGGLLDSLVSAKSDLVVVRQGNYTFLLAQARGGVGNPSVDSGRTEQLVRLAGQRLAAAIGGR